MDYRFKGFLAVLAFCVCITALIAILSISTESKGTADVGLNPLTQSDFEAAANGTITSSRVVKIDLVQTATHIVKTKVEETEEVKEPDWETIRTMASEDEIVVWLFLIEKGLPEQSVAGIMGNLQAESSIRANNLQNSYSRKFGLSDEDYTRLVDKGEYKNFASDSAGYGIAQWTYSTLKADLLSYAQETGRSIGDLKMQLEFLWEEFQRKPKLLEQFMNAETVLEASNVMLLQYERPANQSLDAQHKRAEYGQRYLDIFCN